MTLDFDPGSGRLRCDPAAFEALVAALGDPRRAPGALRAAGALTPAGIHPALVPGLTAVTAPVCQLRLRIAGPDHDRLHQGWIGAGAAAWLMPTAGSEYEFLTLAPDQTPAVLARTLRLGPRRDRGGPAVRVDAEVLAALFTAENTADRATALAGVIAALPEPETAEPETPEAHAQTTSTNRPWRLATLDAAWPGASGALGERALILLDGPPGWLRLEHGPEPEADPSTLTLAPVTASQLWLDLVTLLPADADLDPAAAPVAV